MTGGTSQFSRRNFLALLGAGAAFVVTGSQRVLAAAAAVERGAGEQGGPGVQFMQQISGDLFNAAKSGTPEAFLRAINRHADISHIAQYSLGTYRDKLEEGHNARYRRGVAKFMSRYFASQVDTYKVDRAVITGERPHGEGGTLVKTRLHMVSGASYSVDFLLTPRGRSFKVRDIRVAGFWLAYFQKRMFERYIASHNGNVEALIAALRV